MRGWLDPAVSVVPVSLLHPPGESQQDAKQQGVQQMTFSQRDAVAAALRYLGKPVRPVVQVDSVLDGAPADGQLQPGDRLLRVDGRPLRGPEQVRALISGRTPGDPVRFVVLRDGGRLAVRFDTEASPEDPTKALAGFVPSVGYLSPVRVTLQLGDVGGPSAGLMFSLGVVDYLTPGPLTDGKAVAGTGTITPSGKVGPIGGIQQKMFGARANDADYFLAPAANCADVVGSIPDGLRVVRVASLDGAVQAVQDIAQGRTGDLPSCDV